MLYDVVRVWNRNKCFGFDDWVELWGKSRRDLGVCVGGKGGVRGDGKKILGEGNREYEGMKVEIACGL